MKKLIALFCLLSSLSLFAVEPLDIIQMGHPTLRAIAKEVSQESFKDPKFQELIDNMLFTMKLYGGVGLAAPQVNESIRLFVMKYLPSVPLSVVINPKLEYIEELGKVKSVEGCLSIQGKSLKLKRYKKVRISYYDRYGKYISRELSDFEAIIAQHEYDHLNGILIVDLVEQMNTMMNFTGYTDAPLM
jgi:peptide deformylase